MLTGLPLDYSVVLKDEEYSLLSSLVYSLSGINLGDNKKELVKARLMKRMRSLKMGTFKEYYDYVLRDSNGTELQSLLDAISTNVTAFFREKGHFDFLARRALPEIMERKKPDNLNKLRLWSCACSSGEEVYTALMTVLEAIPNPMAWDIKMLGTDISSHAVAAARKGQYAEEKIKDIPGPLLEKYFKKQADGAHNFYMIKPSISEKAAFARLNLMSESYPFQGKFDIIFCRNVMIYFDKATQAELINKLYRYLENGGFLFIGHAESLLGVKSQFHNVGTAVFQKNEAHKAGHG